VRRQRNKQPDPIKYIKLRSLYGDKCCYCAGLMCFDVNQYNMNDPYIRSLEHIIDYIHKKTNCDKYENLLLSHRQCNSIVGARRFTLEQKEYYIENPHKFIEDCLNGVQINYKVKK